MREMRQAIEEESEMKMPEMPEKKTRKKRTTARTIRKTSAKSASTTTRKRRSAPRKQALFTATLSFERSTKGTHVFTDGSDDAPVPSLYVRKSLFPTGPPPTLTLTLA
jgi:hypothetical protein